MNKKLLKESRNDIETLKEGLSTEEELEKLPAVYLAFKNEDDSYRLKTSWVKSTKQAHNNYLSIDKALKDKYGKDGYKLTYVRNEWRDNQKEVQCVLDVKILGEIKNNESLKESMETEVNTWWKEVEKSNKDNNWGFNIDNTNSTVEEKHSAMFDMINSLKGKDDDLFKKGKSIYNKYAKYSRYNETLKEEYKTLPEFAQDDFEQRLLKIGFILDDETSLYGSKNEYRSWRHEDANDIHYQIISKDKYTEDEFKDVVDKLYELIDLFEEDYDCNITMSAGLGYDGRITAGIDIRDYWEADEGTDQVAPKKPSKLRFKNGKLEDTEENEFVIKDITSHMKGITKDDIEAAAPVDKKKTESLDKPKLYKVEKDIQWGNGYISHTLDYIVATDIDTARKCWQNAQNEPLLDTEIKELTGEETKDIVNQGYWGFDAINNFGKNKKFKLSSLLMD